MKEEYRFLLTGTQKIWLHNQLQRLENEWQFLALEVWFRGKYSDFERGQLNELGRLVKTKKNTIDNKII
jgi:hypothetical protein